MNGTSGGATNRFPQLVRVRQKFAATPPIDVRGEVRAGLAPLAATLAPGARVAVAVGSRGITGLFRIVAAAIDTLRESGARPFIVPAMGSHGGATPEGQVELLAGYGITEAALGVAIRPSMEVRQVGVTVDGVEVVWGVEALGADAVLVVNRIKPHTDFLGGLGSGLMKMLVVGLGKHVGAATFHRAASQHGYERVLRTAAALVLARLPVLGGLAIVENQRHETAGLEVIPAAGLIGREEQLGVEANRLMPRLPFGEIDLLIVDRMGKNISGTGMDPAVIGRMIHGYSLSEEVERRSPHVRRLFVRDLTPESHGNALGLGMADFTTDRLIRAMDRNVTITNSLTALSLQGAKIPIAFASDREVLHAALGSLAVNDPARIRVVRIRDTLSVEDLAISTALAESLPADGSMHVEGPPQPMAFDAAGNLAD